MLLRKNPEGYRAWIGVGQLFLFGGLAAADLVDSGALTPALTNLLGAAPPADLIRGLAYGAAVPLLAASIFFHVRGERLYRQRRG